MIICSCTNPYFSKKNIYHCIPENNNTNYSTDLLPIDIGNRWEYSYNYKQEYLSKLSGEERDALPKKYTLEVGEKTFIYANTDEGKKEIVAYKIIQNGIESKYLYFIKCSEGASIVEVNDYENLEIAGSLLIRNNPKSDVHYWNGISRAKYEWLEETKEDSPLGPMNLYPLKEFVYNENILNPNNDKLRPDMLFKESATSWYSLRVGLVKKELMEDKKVIGYLELVDYDVERMASPISP